MASRADELNRRAWTSRHTIGLFVRRTGYFSAGEAQVMQLLAAEAKDRPLLDIGVGGGRTTEFLREITADYIGVDYLGELVDAARRRFPGARFERVDARDLSRFAPDQFAAVVFSRNGLDGMSHADRATVLAEILRVLRPGGWFAYSTHNLAYATGDARWRPDPRRTVGHPVQAVGYVTAQAWRKWHRFRLRSAAESGDGWVVRASRAYRHPVLWHHVTCIEALRELRRAEFTGAVEIYTSDGIDALAGGAEQDLPAMAHPTSQDLHVLAQTPAEAAAACDAGI